MQSVDKLNPNRQHFETRFENLHNSLTYMYASWYETWVLPNYVYVDLSKIVNFMLTLLCFTMREKIFRVFQKRDYPESKPSDM